MVILLYKWLFLASAIFGNGDLATGKTAGARHPLYISVTEMEHNVTDKNLEISCKIFTDDFEKTLASVFRAKVDLTAPADKGEADRMVRNCLLC